MKTKILFLSLVTILSAFLFPGCKKKKVDCSNYVNDQILHAVYIKLVDKQTGADLITTKGITAEQIKITKEETTEQIRADHWMINTRVPGNPYDGTLQLMVFPLEEPEQVRKITFGNLGTFTLSYKMTKVVNTDPSPCGPGYYYSLSDVKIKDHEYENMKIQDTVHPYFLIIKI
ncbi:hypothetical protein [Desertivirga arenae]|uniref:hypothetical protein n=1 Tax=Desertivirga arenae TaxID=2810309 RepID=UPI001A96F1D7|nr:hypothetical protein [Pedobacter sp. SYSU D00823]